MDGGHDELEALLRHNAELFHLPVGALEGCDHGHVQGPHEDRSFRQRNVPKVVDLLRASVNLKELGIRERRADPHPLTVHGQSNLCVFQSEDLGIVEKFFSLCEKHNVTNLEE